METIHQQSMASNKSYTKHGVKQMQFESRPHRVPVLGEVISIVDEEVTAVDMDEGPQAQILGPIALLPHQLLVGARHVEVLHHSIADTRYTALHFSVVSA